MLAHQPKYTLTEDFLGVRDQQNVTGNKLQKSISSCLFKNTTYFPDTLNIVNLLHKDLLYSMLA